MPSSKRIFTLRLDVADYEKMRDIAAQDNRSMANYIEKLVKDELSKRKALLDKGVECYGN